MFLRPSFDVRIICNHRAVASTRQTETPALVRFSFLFFFFLKTEGKKSETMLNT